MPPKKSKAKTPWQEKKVNVKKTIGELDLSKQKNVIFKYRAVNNHHLTIQYIG